jgi:hypothetical protein
MLEISLLFTQYNEPETSSQPIRQQFPHTTYHITLSDHNESLSCHQIRNQSLRGCPFGIPE